jgi:hypothetical protein
MPGSKLAVAIWPGFWKAMSWKDGRVSLVLIFAGIFVPKVHRGVLPAPDYELQRRVVEAERRNRGSRLWVLAVISAQASVVSALTAFWAVVKK